MENIKLIAVYVADSINIKQLRSVYTGKLITSTSSELFYKTGEGKYISIFNYGAVAFSNYLQAEIDSFFKEIGTFITDKPERISETIQIEFKGEKGVSYENEVLSLPLIDNSDELFRIVMFDLAQTVALDYYADVTDKLLQEVKTFATQLQRKGKISLSRKEMMKFIGKSLTTKNEIVDNLYIFDSPDIAWDNEMVERVHKILIRTFDLNVRFKELEYTFNIIDNNLHIFNDINEHRYSEALEIVVIILILIEVLKSLGEKFMFF